MENLSFGRFLLAGLLSGIVGGAVAIALYLLLAAPLDYEIQTAGSDNTQLYATAIGFASIFPNVIGAVLLYFLRKTGKPVAIFASLAVAVTVLNSIFSQVQLAEEYRLVSHVLHVAVAAVAVYLIPRLARRS